MEVSSEAQKLVNEVGQELKNSGKEMDKEKKKQVKKDCKNLEKLLMKLRLDHVTEQEVTAIRQAKQQLESSSGKNI
jgi:molecular chaperone DnaK